MSYDYNRMMCDIKILNSNYSDFIEYFSIGKSVMERDIPCMCVGRGEKKLLLIGAHHGLEYLTSAFLTKFLSNYIVKLITNTEYFGHDIRELYKKATLFIVPMMNPDGVDIAINGLDITNPYHRRLISMVGIHSFDTVWQANARGVDLNHNYDADWSMVAERPAPSKFGGEHPESEPETQAVVKLIRENNIDMILAFHSQGREIYYDFGGLESKRARSIALKLSDASGYTVAHPTGTAAFGGCKDWFIGEFGKEGYTIEIGEGKNPLPDEALYEIYDENARLVLTAMNEL